MHGRFVAGGPNGTVMFSASGARWRMRATPTTQNLECIAYGNRTYVAGGDSVIVSSRNGIKWQATTVSIWVRNIEFVNGWFVATGQTGVLASHDGLTWESIDVHGNASDLSTLVSGNGILVGAVGLNLYLGILNLPEDAAR